MVETVPGIAADVVAGAGGAAADASPDHRSAQRRDAARASNCPTSSNGWTETGVLAAPSSPEELQRRIETEIELYSKIAEVNGIKAD